MKLQLEDIFIVANVDPVAWAYLFGRGGSGNIQGVVKTRRGAWRKVNVWKKANDVPDAHTVVRALYPEGTFVNPIKVIWKKKIYESRPRRKGENV